jgi:hypothetical protein
MFVQVDYIRTEETAAVFKYEDQRAAGALLAKSLSIGHRSWRISLEMEEIVGEEEVTLARQPPPLLFFICMILIPTCLCFLIGRALVLRLNREPLI